RRHDRLPPVARHAGPDPGGDDGGRRVADAGAFGDERLAPLPRPAARRPHEVAARAGGPPRGGRTPPRGGPPAPAPGPPAPWAGAAVGPAVWPGPRRRGVPPEPGRGPGPGWPGGRRPGRPRAVHPGPSVPALNPGRSSRPDQRTEISTTRATRMTTVRSSGVMV